MDFSEESREEDDETVKKIRQESFEIKRNRFRLMIQNIRQEEIQIGYKEKIHKAINELLGMYKNLFSDVDYALIAYAYMKIGMKEEGISIAQNYLKLEKLSANDLKSKIYEVLENADKTRKNEIETSGVNGKLRFASENYR